MSEHILLLDYLSFWKLPVPYSIHGAITTTITVWAYMQTDQLEDPNISNTVTVSSQIISDTLLLRRLHLFTG